MKLTKLLPSLLSLSLITLAYIFTVLPVLHDGLFHVYDNVHISRLIAFSTELMGGQFPVRYLDSFGHGAGYFLFKFYSPLIYYLGSAIHLLGFSYIQSIKLIYLFFITLGTLGIYTLLRSLVGKFSSTIGTIAFLLSPYLYHVFFHRGTLTEAAAMMLVPWVIHAFLRLRSHPTPTRIVLAGLSIGLIILTHTLTAIMGILIIFTYLALPPYSPSTIKSFILSIVLGVGLSAFFFLPSITSSHLVQYTSNSLVERGYLDHPVSLASQAFALGDGTGKSAFLGLTLIVGFLLTFSLTIFSGKFRNQHTRVLTLSLIITSLGLFIISPASEFIWANIIYLRYVQFPFRFLTIVTITATILYGLLLDYFKRSHIIQTILTTLIFVPFLLYPQFYQPLGYQYTTNYKVEDPCMTSAWADEHLSIWVDQCLLKPRVNLVESLSPDLAIDQIIISNNGRSTIIHTSGTGDLLISKYYFPGWVATSVGGQDLSLSPHSTHGLIKLSVRNSDSPITLTLQETKLEIISNWITVISLLISGLLIYSHYVKHPRTKN